MVEALVQGPATKACRYTVVGADTADNFRLAEILHRSRGKDAVARFLELNRAEVFIEREENKPLIIFLDLFGFDLLLVTNFIGQIRDNCPTVVFSLFLDKAEFEAKLDQIPEQWRDRLLHYYKLYKEDDPDIEFEPAVRAALHQIEWEANYNVTNEPIRLTPLFERGLSVTESNSGRSDENIAFVSYARHDWNNFVSRLVSDLAKEPHKVWIDQHYLAGGDDWMDAVGQALQICNTLLLILSPASMSSKYVKMEYRYFVRYDKPIIPLLYRAVDHMPFELSTINYIDFTKIDCSDSYQQLVHALSRRGQRAPAQSLL